eukprot:899499-Rhodomonas_salina.1
MSSLRRPACCNVLARRLRCASGFGAVSTEVRPSWFTVDERMTASTRSLSRKAADSRLHTTTPAPSPLAIAVPLPAASSGLQESSGEMMPTVR